MGNWKEVAITSVQELRVGMRMAERMVLLDYSVCQHGWKTDEGKFTNWRPDSYFEAAIEFGAKFEIEVPDEEPSDWEEVKVASVDELDSKREYSVRVGDEKWLIVQNHKFEWFVEHEDLGWLDIRAFIKSQCPVFRKREPKVEEPLRMEITVSGNGKAYWHYKDTWFVGDEWANKEAVLIEKRPGEKVVVVKEGDAYKSVKIGTDNHISIARPYPFDVFVVERKS
jgi:hypothetical protein